MCLVLKAPPGFNGQRLLLVRLSELTPLEFVSFIRDYRGPSLVRYPWHAALECMGGDDAHIVLLLRWTIAAPGTIGNTQPLARFPTFLSKGLVISQDDVISQSLSPFPLVGRRSTTLTIILSARGLDGIVIEGIDPCCSRCRAGEDEQTQLATGGSSGTPRWSLRLSRFALFLSAFFQP